MLALVYESSARIFNHGYGRFGRVLRSRFHFHLSGANQYTCQRGVFNSIGENNRGACRCLGIAERSEPDSRDNGDADAFYPNSNPGC